MVVAMLLSISLTKYVNKICKSFLRDIYIQRCIYIYIYIYIYINLQILCTIYIYIYIYIYIQRYTSAILCKIWNSKTVYIYRRRFPNFTKNCASVPLYIYICMYLCICIYIYIYRRRIPNFTKN